MTVLSVLVATFVGVALAAEDDHDHDHDHEEDPFEDIASIIYSSVDFWPAATKFNDLRMDELSGMTYNPEIKAHVGVVDLRPDPSVEGKGLFEFKFTDAADGSVSYQITGVDMEKSDKTELTGFDAESIAYVLGGEYGFSNSDGDHFHDEDDDHVHSDSDGHDHDGEDDHDHDHEGEDDHDHDHDDDEPDDHDHDAHHDHAHGDGWYVVAQEGHSTYSTNNWLFLYYTNGSFAGDITSQLDSRFGIANTENNRGIKGMSAAIAGFHWFAYATESPLKSDQTACPATLNCVRISLNEYAMPNGEFQLKQKYQIRYDLDKPTGTAVLRGAETNTTNYVGLADLQLINNFGKLFALVLERGVSPNGYTAKIYIADLNHADDDVSMCASLSDAACASLPIADKELLFDFGTIPASDLEGDDLVSELNFEVLSVRYPDEMSTGLVQEPVNIVALTDNGELQRTYMVHLTWVPPTPSPTMEMEDAGFTLPLKAAAAFTFFAAFLALVF